MLTVQYKHLSNMKKYFILLCLLASFYLNAQTPLWQWINIDGSTGNTNTNGYRESVRSMGTDAWGNIYAISSVSSSTTRIDTLHKSGGFGFDDFVVYSYRCDGTFRWARFFGSSNNDRPGGLVVTPQGDVFVCGTVVVGPNSDAHFGDHIIYQNSTYNKATFIARLDSAGQTQWVNLPGHNFAQLQSTFYDMVQDNQGNPVAFGWFGDSTTWDGFHIPQMGHYLITFDPMTGAMARVTKLDFKYDWNYTLPIKITMDADNNLFLTTSIGVQIVLGQDTVVRPTDPFAYMQSILAKFDSTGQKVWHQVVGGVNSQHANPIPYQILTGKPVVYKDYIYIAGETQSHSNSSFLGVPVVNPIAYSGTLRTQVIARFNKHTGAFVGATNFWHRHIMSDPMIVANNDKIYMVSAGGRLIILNQTDTVQPFTNDLMGHLYIIEADTALTSFYGGVVAKVLSHNTATYFTAAMTDNNGNILLGGHINGPVVSSLGDTSQIIGGSTDFFIAKVAPTNTNCGCKPPDPKPQLVSLYNKELTVQGNTTIGADSLAWLWGDGTSTLYTQPGTTISHTYQQGGNYTVCLRAWNICGVSDSCFQVMNVGVNELVIQNPELVVYPNPFKDALNIELPENMTGARIVLYDLAGKQVLSLNVPNNRLSQTITLDTSTLEPGIYIIHLVTKESGRFVTRVVKRN
jgi:hypothetical protein